MSFGIHSTTIGTSLDPLAMVVRDKPANQSNILCPAVGAGHPETSIIGELTHREGRHEEITRWSMSHTLTTVMLGLGFSKDSATFKEPVLP